MSEKGLKKKRKDDVEMESSEKGATILGSRGF